MSEFLYSLLMASWTSTKQLKTKTQSKLTNRKIWILLMTFLHSEGEKTSSLKNICIVDAFRITFSNFLKSYFQEIKKNLIWIINTLLSEFEIKLCIYR